MRGERQDARDTATPRHRAYGDDRGSAIAGELSDSAHADRADRPIGRSVVAAESRTPADLAADRDRASAIAREHVRGAQRAAGQLPAVQRQRPDGRDPVADRAAGQRTGIAIVRDRTVLRGAAIAAAIAAGADPAIAVEAGDRRAAARGRQDDRGTALATGARTWDAGSTGRSAATRGRAVQRARAAVAAVDATVEHGGPVDRARHAALRYARNVRDGAPRDRKRALRAAAERAATQAGACARTLRDDAFASLNGDVTASGAYVPSVRGQR